uniref:U3 small nucleolar RNA-interacting protein 2 n=1 Tax=Lygus hesperus TaxID=30085 RepID=A0A0A9Z2T8_LYGHE
MLSGARDIHSIDTVAAFSPKNFISGAQDGSIQLWANDKRKPVAMFPSAHSGKWIGSCATKYGSNIAITGSSDGYVRGWHANLDTCSLSQIFSVPVVGFCNGICIDSVAGAFAVVAVGQEHRLGRWERISNAKNS